MTTTRLPIQPDLCVGWIASTMSGAARVFHRHSLDFRCGGRISLGEARASSGLDADAVIAEIQDEAPKPGSFERCDERPLSGDDTPAQEACGTWNALATKTADPEQLKRAGDSMELERDYLEAYITYMHCIDTIDALVSHGGSDPHDPDPDEAHNAGHVKECWYGN